MTLPPLRFGEPAELVGVVLELLLVADEPSVLVAVSLVVPATELLGVLVAVESVVADLPTFVGLGVEVGASACTVTAGVETSTP